MRLAGLGLAALILQACGGDAKADDDAVARHALATRAIAEAKSMPSTYHRDIALRAISRNLRWVDCDLAREAASAMEDKDELRTFGRCPDDLGGMEPSRPGKGEEPRCVEDVRRLISSGADKERRLRDYFDLDGPPRAVYALSCSFEATTMAADALPPGDTKVALLFRATSDGEPDSDRRMAVQRLRALLPRLDGDLRTEAQGWLDTADIDLIEDRPDAAIDRVRRAFEPQQAYGLIGHFLRERDIERAVTVTGLLPPSSDCTRYDEGLTGLFSAGLPHNAPVIADYLDHLRAGGIWDRLCPNGVGPDIAAAAATGIPIRLARMRAEVADRQLRAGKPESARPLVLAGLAAAPQIDAGTAMDRTIAARLRIRILNQLVQIGEAGKAERLAASFPGPGWRGFAYSVMAAAKGRLAGRKAAVFVDDIGDVPVDR